MALVLVPLERDEANELVARWHRHHLPPQGDRFRVGCAEDGERICGVAIVGRPVARRLDDGWTVEVLRVATDGTKNACSFLYGAARRAAFALGYKRVLTYTLPSEGGGIPSRGRLPLHWRGRRRLVVARVAASRGHTPDASEI